jgi:hypothetical protein
MIAQHTEYFVVGCPASIVVYGMFCAPRSVLIRVGLHYRIE